jgi:hypothetical protein
METSQKFLKTIILIHLIQIIILVQFQISIIKYYLKIKTIKIIRIIKQIINNILKARITV